MDLLFVRAKNDKLAIASLKRLIDGFADSPRPLRVRTKAVNNNLDDVNFIALKLLNILEALNDAINTSTYKAPAPKVFQRCSVIAFASTHDRGEQSQSLSRSFRQDLLNDLFWSP
jgi:hypothetical protein